MSPYKVRLHCLVKHEAEGYFAAYCLNYTLYAVGETSDEAKEKLFTLIDEYVRDAIVGADAEFGEQLLARRAPLIDWIKFYMWWGWQSLTRLRDNLHHVAFRHVIPLVPPCSHHV